MTTPDKPHGCRHIAEQERQITDLPHLADNTPDSERAAVLRREATEMLDLALGFKTEADATREFAAEMRQFTAELNGYERAASFRQEEDAALRVAMEPPHNIR